ncbi:MAG: Stf0 family sulfotransferase [Pseudonocardiales bacterium]
MLRSTGVAGRPESYFRLADEQSWADRWQLTRDSDGCFDYQDFVRAAVAEGSTDNGVFGARVMWATMEEIVARLGAVRPELAGTDLDRLTGAFGRTRFLHLWRENTLAQAVSWARAEQINYWHPGDTATPGRDPRFDFEQIHGLVETIEAHNAAWRAWFAASDVRPHLVGYEELIADVAGVMDAILNFLGLQLPDDRTIAPRNHRQADETNNEWIDRYRATAECRTVG